VRVSLTHKILAGYLTVAIFFAIASGYALYSFSRIHAQHGQASMPSLEGLQSLQEIRSALLALDRLDRSPVPDFDPSREASEALRAAIGAGLGRIDAAANDPSLRSFSSEVRLYLQLFSADRLPEGRAAGGAEMAAQPSVRTLLASLEALIAARQAEIQHRFAAAERAAGQAYEAFLYLAVLGLAAGLVPALFVARHFKGALGKLKNATQMFADGAFDFDPEVQSSDEVGELAVGLKIMAEKLKNYEQLCLDASPLTRLPGNIAIERALLEKIRHNENFALCYADLDDFKAYNDIYGYAKGSEIIKVTGELLHNAKRRHGGADDFVGHIGGDDFVLITAPENASVICESIIGEFDRVIPFFYSEQDRGRGYIETTDRYGVTRQFPLMSISIAVVSDVSRDILSPTEIAQVAAEIKDYVKTLPGSNYLVDRRRSVRKSLGGQSDG